MTVPRVSLSAAALASIAEAHLCRPADGGNRGQVSEVPTSLVGRGDPIPVSDLGPTRPFAEALATRRSHRQLAPPHAVEVGTVLARAGLVRRRWPGTDGYPESSRPAPSPGARHPHLLVLIASHVTGLEQGTWILDPDGACLLPGAQSPAACRRALEAVADAMGAPEPPPAVVFTVARPALTLARYTAGMPLLWREAGALQCTLHLAATDLGLGSCVVGTAGVLHTYSVDGLLDTGAVAMGVVA